MSLTTHFIIACKCCTITFYDFNVMQTKYSRINNDVSVNVGKNSNIGICVIHSCYKNLRVGFYFIYLIYQDYYF